MASLLLLPIADQLESGTYLLHDDACGTGGMVTVGEATLLELAGKLGKEVSLHLCGQEVNKAIYDQLLAHKAEIDAAFGEPLSWERLEGKRACRIRHTQTGGGYRSPEDHWPAIQDTAIKDTDRLEKALRPHLKQLKLNA